MNKHQEHISKFISLILRHKPETIGISLDTHGWANIDELIKGMKQHDKFVELSDLIVVVEKILKGDIL